MRCDYTQYTEKLKLAPILSVEKFDAVKLPSISAIVKTQPSEEPKIVPCFYDLLKHLISGATSGPSHSIRKSKTIQRSKFEERIVSREFPNSNADFKRL